MMLYLECSNQAIDGLPVDELQNVVRETASFEFTRIVKPDQMRCARQFPAAVHLRPNYLARHAMLRVVL